MRNESIMLSPAHTATGVRWRVLVGRGRLGALFPPPLPGGETFGSTAEALKAVEFAVATDLRHPGARHSKVKCL